MTTAADGKRYKTKLYNLSMILAIGYRVESLRGTQFRRWATSHLQEYLVKGFVMDDARLKEPGGRDYFDEWLEGIRVRQQDVIIAKNYLSKPELEELNQIVVMYLDYAESQAKRRKTITMREWEEKLDLFLSFNEKDLLNHAGKISAQVAEKLVLSRYSEFSQNRLREERLKADSEDLALLEKLVAKTDNEAELGIE